LTKVFESGGTGGADLVNEFHTSGPELRHTDLTWRRIKKALAVLQNEFACGTCRLAA